MKKAGVILTGVLLLLLSAVLPSAATDCFYQLNEVTPPPAWDGTDANRTKATASNYDYTYGDEASVTYTLPWAFNYYGTTYTNITADTNGNIWLGNTPGSVHSFSLANINRPVIAAWNNDLSSYYYGGVFIQHKNDAPLGERVVIEWQTETYTEEGFSRPNNFAVVLFQNGNIRIDYKSFTTTSGKDFGSGISKGDGTANISLTSDTTKAYNLTGKSFLVTGIPKISVVPTNDSFGNGYVNVVNPSHSFTVRNQGPCDLDIGQVTLGNTNANQFSLISNGCTGQRLNGTTTCTIQVAFAPTVTGSAIADLLISSNDMSSPVATVPLNGNGVLPTLDIIKYGSGSGIVTGAAVGINCGATCSASAPGGTAVTLTAAADPGSWFAGWSGGGCTAAGNCNLTLNANTTITATLNLLPVYADFSTTTTSVGAPSNVTFSNLSQRATSYLWDFGDGSTSTLQNPTHYYQNQGTYTVKLTASNASYSDDEIKTSYITVNPCQNLPAKIVGKSSYSTIQAAYDAAVSGDVILLQAKDYTESFTANRDILLNINGGYSCDYTVNPGTTVIKGAPRLSSGTVNMKDIRISQ